MHKDTLKLESMIYVYKCLDDYRLLYSWLYNTDIYLDECPDDYHIGRAEIYVGIVQSTV